MMGLLLLLLFLLLPLFDFLLVFHLHSQTRLAEKTIKKDKKMKFDHKKTREVSSPYLEKERIRRQMKKNLRD